MLRKAIIAVCWQPMEGLWSLLELAMTLIVGVQNDSVVHKFVLVKKFVYAVLLESDFLSQMDTVLGYAKLGYHSPASLKQKSSIAEE